MYVVTRQDLRRWAARMSLTSATAARALGLAQPGYNAKLYGTRPIDRRTSILAAYYEADPALAERILTSIEEQAPPV
jgi:hypothetical protein